MTEQAMRKWTQSFRFGRCAKPDRFNHFIFPPSTFNFDVLLTCLHFQFCEDPLFMVLSITIFELDRNNSICRQQSALYIVRPSHSIQLRTSDPALYSSRAPNPSS
jgi:hypothetical protein